MFNPFKKRYKITEFSNEQGDKHFEATFISLFDELLWTLDMFFGPIYLTIEGDLEYRNLIGHESDHRTLEDARKAIEAHKKKIEEVRSKTLKPSSIHYVN